MLDDFNIITTSPYLPTNAVFKTNISFWIRVIFLWGNAVCFAGTISKPKYDVFLEKLHHALWRSAVCISDVQPSFQRSSTPFRKVNISAWYMQYYRHRASLSKVQYVWNCEHYHMFKQCLIVLRFNDGHSSSYNIFKGAAYTKGCYSQNMVRCLGRISHYAFRKMMCNCERHILRAYMYHVFFI